MKEYLCNFIDNENIELDSPCWTVADTQSIDEYPWKNEQRLYEPTSQFKVLHNEEALFIRFDIWEENIRATYTKPNDPVCRDSCVEFFFNPDKNDNRYLSFEVNPLGTLLIGLSTSGKDLVYLEDSREIFDIQCNLKEGFWQVSYKIPFAFIKKYFKNISTTISGNFMKCADLSITPHHGSWNLIETDIPMFHVPEFFGKIKLVEKLSKEVS